MTEDFIDKTFSDLDEYYPGSKRKRGRPKKEKAERVIPTWDSAPVKKTLPNGKDVELFTIGALAKAVGRPVASIRAWIAEGYIPAAPYRLPSKPDKHGKPMAGRRLWSRAMIQALVDKLNNAGLLDVRRIEWPQHQQLSIEIAEAWNNIRAEETA